MKVLVVGSGGREHALAWKLRQSPDVDQVYCVPGNAGIAQEASCIPAAITSNEEVACLSETLGVSFTVVGPEAPLAAGLVDELHAHGQLAFGPLGAAARLEGSKVFAKQFMRKHNIPTAEFAVVGNQEEASAALDRFGLPVTLKADGLAAGKGVIIARTREEADQAVQGFLSGELVSGAGRTLVIEEFLTGEEASFIAVCDGSKFLAFPPTQDHKPALDNDEGPNTGGMGAYCDDRILSEGQVQTIVSTIVAPTLAGMAADGTPFQGFLYVGLMMTSDGPKVLEFNVRMGDPETQPILSRLDGDFAGFLRSAAAGEMDASLIHWQPGVSTCVVVASGGYPGSYQKGRLIHGLRAAEAAGAKVFHAGTKLAGGRVVTSGGRVLGVTTVAGDLPTSISRCYDAVGKIQFDGMHYRHDIGAKGLARWV